MCISAESSSFLETFRSTKRYVRKNASGLLLLLQSGSSDQFVLKDVFRMGPTEKKDAAGISENFEVAPEESVSSISEMAAQERPQARLIGYVYVRMATFSLTGCAVMMNCSELSSEEFQGRMRLQRELLFLS